MTSPNRPQAWVWRAACLQLSGLLYDAVWHGVLHPDFEGETVVEMVHHLATVHLLLYVGVVSVLVTTGWVLLGQLRRRENDTALRVAFAGALLSTAGGMRTPIST
jgi:hypothetical protein